MIKYNFNEKVALLLSLLILNNLLLIGLNFPDFFLKINLILFFIVLLGFYFLKPFENWYLKFFFVLIILISLGTPTFEWDPRSIWLFHAKRIFLDSSIFSVADNYAPFSHNAYPNLIPAFASSLATFVGHWNEIFPKTAFSFAFLPPLIVSYVFFKDVKYLIFISLVFFIVGKYLFTGWADGLVAVYFSLSAFLTYLLFIDEKSSYKKERIFYLITFSFFTSLTLIKNEGFALLSILFLSTIIILIYKRKFKENFKKVFYLSFAFLPIILWKIFCYYNGIGNDYVNLSFFSNILPRIFDFENYILISYYLLLNEKFLFSFLFFAVIFWTNWNKDLFIFVIINAALYLLVLFLVFLSTPLDFYFQLDSTAARVVKTLSFLLAFFGLYNLKLRNDKILN